MKEFIINILFYPTPAIINIGFIIFIAGLILGRKRPF